LIGDERFDAALLQVLESSTFRPDIAEIRRAAGVVTPEQRESREAKEAFQAILDAMRIHGPQLKRKRGKLIREKDDEGRVLTIPEYEWIEGPTFSPVVEAAILDLGYGVRGAGLDVISRHPALNPPPRNQDGDGSEHSFRNKLAKDIDNQWLEAFRQARTSTQRS
jgi:hypothetical protein